MPAEVPTETAVLVVGGGPAGLATAIELRQQGMEVLVVDRSRPPIDKACGEGLMPDGVDRLAALGVEVARLESSPLAGIRYVDGDLEAEALFEKSPGRGVRRPILHRAMVERAKQVGVSMVWGVAVRGLRLVSSAASTGLEPAKAINVAATDDGDIRARWMVGADGLHSRVREWAGLRSRKARFHRYGVRRHYDIAPWTDRVEVHWTDHAEAYVTPVSPRSVGVAFLWSGEKADFDRLLERFPELAGRLRGATPASEDRGAARLEQRTLAAYRGRVVLVGDAAGYRDAITGEGMSLAFHQARALASAIAADDLERYQRELRRLTMLPNLLIRLLLEAERRPWLRRRLIRTLATEPGLFAKLLAVHTRDASPRSIGGAAIIKLARGLLG